MPLTALQDADPMCLLSQRKTSSHSDQHHSGSTIWFVTSWDTHLEQNTPHCSVCRHFFSVVIVDETPSFSLNEPINFKTGFCSYLLSYSNSLSLVFTFSLSTWSFPTANMLLLGLAFLKPLLTSPPFHLLPT